MPGVLARVLGRRYSGSIPIRAISVATCLRPMNALATQRIAQHARAHEWVLQMQRVDPTHDRQIAPDTGRGR